MQRLLRLIPAVRRRQDREAAELELLLTSVVLGMLTHYGNLFSESLIEATAVFDEFVSAVDV